MSQIQSSRGPGRPKSPAKRDAVLAAARKLFLERGYAQTSMDLVAEAAGVGKATVYSHFGSKEELFDAIVAVRKQTVTSQFQPLEAPSDDPREDLEQFVLRFYELVLNHESHLWARLVISEAGRQPELARKLFIAGPANGLALLTRYVEAQAAAGRLHVADAESAAEHLLGLVLGIELPRVLMASQPRRTKGEIKRRARAAIAVFMAAYGPRGGGKE